MKKSLVLSFLFPCSLFFSLLLICNPANSQDAAKASATLPDSINKIVTNSCTPCHTSQGGLMSKSKLNITEWTNYSPEKQKEKAAKMYSEINKGAMPPKAAREKRPESIPTNDQLEIIKRWSESLTADKK
jgi:mono/diheme cytochrome c family protein